MSYSLSISGHVQSKKQEAAILSDAADLAEKHGAEGAFSFSGSHFSIYAPAPAEAIAKAREAVAAYNAEADTDDQVAAATSPDSDAGEADPEDTEA